MALHQYCREPPLSVLSPHNPLNVPVQVRCRSKTAPTAITLSLRIAGTGLRSAPLTRPRSAPPLTHTQILCALSATATAKMRISTDTENTTASALPTSMTLLTRRRHTHPSARRIRKPSACSRTWSAGPLRNVNDVKRSEHPRSCPIATRPALARRDWHIDSRSYARTGTLQTATTLAQDHLPRD